MSRFPRRCVGGADENVTVIYQNLLCCVCVRYAVHVSLCVSCSVKFQFSCSAGDDITFVRGYMKRRAARQKERRDDIAAISFTVFQSGA